MTNLKTPWTDLVSSKPLQEYPRPQFQRDSYLNLNGWWQYAITKDNYAPQQFDGKILVPFSPESVLSGVNRQLKPDEYLHYRTTFTLPKSFNKGIVLLHFGAVDNRCTVSVNGLKVGRHEGGFTSFSLDITMFIAEGENVLEVTVKDGTEKDYLSTGKQRLKKGKIWYTAQSGIWQTVWLESVAKQHIRSAKIVPDFDNAQVNVYLDKQDVDSVTAIVYDNGVEVAKVDSASDTICLQMPTNFVAWSPENPKLYNLVLISRRDKVTSYFGMRKFSIKRDYFGYLRTMLNNKPYFLCGVLDQGYWSDGLYTAPTDQALAWDVQTAKDLGFNTLRKHVKIEPLRWYYHCDRLGIIVWQDAPCSPKTNCFVSKIAPFFAIRKLNDTNYRLFARANEKARAQFRTEYVDMLNQLGNVVSIAVWNVFNEGWGQFDSQEFVQLTKQMDPTRLVNPASGWHDQGGGDFKSRHAYFCKPYAKSDKRRAVAISECGGYGYQEEGHVVAQRSFSYRSYKTNQDLVNALDKLFNKQIKPLVKKGLTACIYTQLTDVETETNGLVTFDRQVIKVKEISRLLKVNQ